MPVDRALPAAYDPRSRFSLIVAIVGLAGVAAVFLPFTSGISPLSATFDGLWQFGVPAMLAILVTLGSFRWIVTGRFLRAERLSAYLAALVAAGCILLLPGVFAVSMLTGQGGGATRPSDGIDWFMFPLLGSLVGAYLLRRNSRTGVPATVNAVAAMQVVYVIVAILSFAIFGMYGWQIGAYLIAMTTLAYMAQIVAVSVAAPGQTALAPK
jgi:hypothetical protein